MAQQVKIIKKRLVFDDFFKIEEAFLQYEQSDGNMSSQVRRLKFERGDSVAAVVYNRETDKVIFTKQFRFPTYEKGQGWIIEIIAGMIEEGESAEKAMRREIVEELGYRVDNLDEIATFYVSPGGSSERIILFYAEVTTDHKDGKGGGIAEEDIQIVEMSRATLQNKMANNQIQDAKTLIGIQYFFNQLKS